MWFSHFEDRANNGREKCVSAAIALALTLTCAVSGSGCAVRWSDGKRDFCAGAAWWSEKTGPGGSIHALSAFGVMIDLVDGRIAVGLSNRQELEAQPVNNTPLTWKAIVENPPTPENRKNDRGFFWRQRELSRDPMLLHETALGLYVGKSFPAGGLFIGIVDAHAVVNVDAMDSCLIIGPRNAGNMDDTFAYRGMP